MRRSSTTPAAAGRTTLRSRVRTWMISSDCSSLDAERWWPVVIAVVGASQRSYRRILRRTGASIDSPGPAFRAFISFGPQARMRLDGAVRLRLGDPRLGCPLWECRVEPDDAGRSDAPVPVRVRLRFPAGRVPGNPGPIPIWQGEVIGQVWGMRPL